MTERTKAQTASGRMGVAVAAGWGAVGALLNGGAWPFATAALLGVVTLSCLAFDQRRHPLFVLSAFAAAAILTSVGYGFWVQSRYTY